MLIPWEMILKQNRLSCASCLDRHQRGGGGFSLRVPGFPEELLSSSLHLFLISLPPSLPQTCVQCSLGVLTADRNTLCRRGGHRSWVQATERAPRGCTECHLSPHSLFLIFFYPLFFLWFIYFVFLSPLLSLLPLPFAAPPQENPSVLMTILEVTCGVGWGTQVSPSTVYSVQRRKEFWPLAARRAAGPEAQTVYQFRVSVSFCFPRLPRVGLPLWGRVPWSHPHPPPLFWSPTHSAVLPGSGRDPFHLACVHTGSHPAFQRLPFPLWIYMRMLVTEFLINLA